MKTLSRAAFLEAARTSAVALLVLVGLFWLLQSLKWLDLLVNKGLSALTFAQLSLYMLPYILVFTLPLAVLFGVSFVAKRWQEEAEAFALYGAGIPPSRLARGVVAFGALCSIALAIVMHVALPYSQQKLQQQRALFLQNQTELTLQAGTFNSFGSYTVFIEQRTSDLGFKGLIVQEKARHNGPSTTWAAQEGTLALNPRTQAPQLVLRNGLRQTLTADGQQRLAFTEHTFALSRMVGDFAQRRLKPKERTWAQLAASEAATPKEQRKFRAERNKRLAWPFLPLALVCLVACVVLQPFYKRTGVGRLALWAVGSGFLLIALMFFLESEAESGARWALLAQLGLPVGVIFWASWRLWPRFGALAKQSASTKRSLPQKQKGKAHG